MRLILLINVVFACHVAGLTDLSIDHYALARSINKFSLTVFKRATEESIGNLVLSPYSAFILLSMVTHGAEGYTEYQLRTALEILKGDSNIEQALKILIDKINILKNDNVGFAYKIFLNDTFGISSEFINRTTTFFGSKPQYLNTSDFNESRQIINEWSKAQTNNHIRNLAPYFMGDEYLILASATVFKGVWMNRSFASLPDNRIFNTKDNREISIPYMRQQNSYRYGQLIELNSKFIALQAEIDGTKEKIDMFIILPNDKDSYADLEYNIQNISLDKLYNSRDRNITLTMPKFKIKTKFDLRGSLANMELDEVFMDAANFPGIIPGYSDIKVNNVIQDVYLEVNEQTENPRDVPRPIVKKAGFKNFTVDRPFISIFATTYDNPIILLIARFIGC